MRTAAIFDVDGTLASNTWRESLAHAGLWDEFHALVGHDCPIPDRVAKLREHHYNGDAIIVCTARMERTRPDTEAWFRLWQMPWTEMHFRGDDDPHSRGWEVKHRMFQEKIADRYEVVAVYEDHEGIVPMWADVCGIHVECLTDPNLHPLFLSPQESREMVQALMR